MATGPFSVFTSPASAQRFASTLLNSSVLMDRSMDRGSRKAAIFLASETRKGIRAQAPGGQALAPLAESTLLAKKPKTKILINKADLLRSIRASNLGGGRWLVGVLRTARNRDGTKLANVAAILTFGVDKQGRPLMPPRPFIEPTVRAHRDKATEIMGNEVFDGLFPANTFGRPFSRAT